MLAEMTALFVFGKSTMLIGRKKR